MIEFDVETKRRINEMGVALLAAKKKISDIRQKQGALMKEIQTRPRMDSPKNRAKLHEYGREVVKIERGVVALAIRDTKEWTPEERAIIEAALQIGGWSWAEIIMLRQVLEKMYMKYVNLTLDTIRLWRGEDDILEIPPSGSVAEVLDDSGNPPDHEQERLPDGALIRYYDGGSWRGRISGFPEEFWDMKDDDMSTVYIVYPRIMHHFSGVSGVLNVVIPDTGRSAIRVDGKLWAVRGWIGCVGDDRISH